MNQQETNNRRLYLSAFSRLHASANLDLEGMIMKCDTKKGSGAVRCRRGLIVTTLIMVMLFAMSAVAFAATDGEIVNDVKSVVNEITVWINGEKLDNSVITKQEDGSFSIDIQPGDQIKIDGNDYEISSENGNFEGKLNHKETDENGKKAAESEIVIEKVPESATEPSAEE